MVIKSIGVVSVGKVYGAISGAFGLIFGGIFTLASLAGAAIGARRGTSRVPRFSACSSESVRS